MDRKGISPLIAAVILLAFAMAIGGIFSEWSGQLVKSSTEDTSDSTDKVLECSGKSIEIARINTGESNNWVNATFRSDGGDIGEVRVAVFPSRSTEMISLDSDGAVNTTGINVENAQESVSASSTSCPISIEEEIDY